MSRYRKVEVRMYGDEKFRRLSAAPPSGQSLWLYLITGPHTNSIPGLSRVGRAALAEELGWPLEAFDKAFAEVFREGMAKADWTNRVVWIPNAIKHNKPESPNVVTHWRGEWELIPECDLKEEARRCLEETLSTMSPALAGAFEALGYPAKSSPKPSAKPMANQEQLTVSSEQEQEQEEQKLGSMCEEPHISPSPTFITFHLTKGKDHIVTEKDISAWELAYPAVDIHLELNKVLVWLEANPEKRSQSTNGSKQRIVKWLGRTQDHGGNSGSTQQNRSINRADAATERQQVSRDAIAEAGRRRYGEATLATNVASTGDEAKPDVTQRYAGYVPASVGGNITEVRDGVIHSRTLEGVV